MHRCPHSWRTMRLPRTNLQARASSAGVTRLCTSEESMCTWGPGKSALNIIVFGLSQARVLDRSTMQLLCSRMCDCVPPLYRVPYRH